MADENLWTEYERRKRELLPMSPEDYDRAIRKILEDLDL